MSANAFPVIGAVTGRTKVALVAVVTLLGLVVPLVVGPYLTNIGINILVLVLFAMSFNLLYGHTGMLSFGHAGYYGFAAYVLVIALQGPLEFLPTAGSFVPALVVAVVLTGVVAALFGAICVQRGGIFFAMLTLALSMMLYEVALQWNSLTGGSTGISMPATTVDLWLVSFGLVDKTAYYYFTFGVVAISILILWRLVNSPYGELLAALRENPGRVEYVGLNVKFYQWTVFVISGMFAGLAGALISVQIFVVSPNTLHWATSATPVLATLLGGPYTFAGPIIGGILFEVLEVLLTTYTQHWQIAIGIILIPLVLFFPGGIVGALSGDEGRVVSLVQRVRGSSGGEDR